MKSYFIINSVAVKKYIDTQIYCPLSGLKLKGNVIAPHKMAMMQCANGALFAKCPYHLVRCFISDFETVKTIMSEAQVIKVIEVQRKGENNAAS